MSQKKILCKSENCPSVVKAELNVIDIPTHGFIIFNLQANPGKNLAKQKCAATKQKLPSIWNESPLATSRFCRDSFSFSFLFAFNIRGRTIFR